MRIESRVRMPSPQGVFTVLVNGEGYTESNTFTLSGLTKVFSSGEILFNEAGGGAFLYCKVGSGTAAFTAESIALQSPYPAVSTISTVSLQYITVGGIRYAEQTATYSFPLGGVVGEVSEVCLSESSTGSSPLCGKSLASPINVLSGDTLSIRYTIRVPVLSSRSLIHTGATTQGGVSIPYTLDMLTHSEVGSTTICTFPKVTSRVANSPYSAFMVNGTTADRAYGVYSCTRSISTSEVSMTITAIIPTTVGATFISYFGFGSWQSDADYSLRISFDSPVSKPVNNVFKVVLTIVFTLDN